MTEVNWKEYPIARAGRIRRVFSLLAPTVLSTRMETGNLDRSGYPEWREERLPRLRDVRRIKIAFTAALPEGGSELQSGLLLLPVQTPGERRALSWVLFLKGTEFRRKEVPSRLRCLELPFAAVLAGLGYAVWTPDYAGMGDSPGIQEYCVPDSLAASASDGLAAARTWLRIQGALGRDGGAGYEETGSLGVMGYSEGGTAVMAFLDSAARGRLALPGLKITAGYPLGALLNMRSIEPRPGAEPVVVPRPAFLVCMALGWARAYPREIRIQNILSPRALKDVIPLCNGTRSSLRLDARIARTFGRKRGRVLNTDLFSPDYLRCILENPQSEPYTRMRDERRLDRCAPSGFPVILAASPEDEIVPYSNSAGAAAWAREHTPNAKVELVRLAAKDHLMGGIESLLYALVDFDKRETCGS